MLLQQSPVFKPLYGYEGLPNGTFIIYTPHPLPETHWLWNQAEYSQTGAPNALLRGEGFIKDLITGIASSFSFYKLESYWFQTTS